MSTLDSGQRVGRYRIVRFLGAGAMGEVYLAEDPHIERRLAIKTVRLTGGRPQDIEDRSRRLLREARAAGRLLHPNVVTLFDAGEEDGLLYLAFEFVEGSDLASRLDSGEPPTLREVLRIVRQVAEALDYAHRQGIVHRDIKPSNILLDAAGHVKVADFGIAKVAGQNTELTMVGSVMGSPQYLSPEQIRGDELDGRSDVFSLGVVLYELLSGRRPFDGETITTLVYQILHKDPAIGELRAVPLRLDQLLHHMLAKDRDDRLATAGLVAEELAAIERELPEATLAAPAAPAPELLDVTRVMPSRSLAPGGGAGGGSGASGSGGAGGGGITPVEGIAVAGWAAAQAGAGGGAASLASPGGPGGPIGSGGAQGLRASPAAAAGLPRVAGAPGAQGGPGGPGGQGAAVGPSPVPVAFAPMAAGGAPPAALPIPPAPAGPPGSAPAGPAPPGTAAARPTPPGTAAARPAPLPPAAGAAVARRSSGARVWLVLVVLLLLCLAVVGVSAFWVWQRYLQRGGQGMRGLLTSLSSSSTASPTASPPQATTASPASVPPAPVFPASPVNPSRAALPSNLAQPAPTTRTAAAPSTLVSPAPGVPVPPARQAAPPATSAGQAGSAALGSSSPSRNRQAPATVAGGGTGSAGSAGGAGGASSPSPSAGAAASSPAGAGGTAGAGAGGRSSIAISRPSQPRTAAAEEGAADTTASGRSGTGTAGAARGGATAGRGARQPAASALGDAGGGQAAAPEREGAAAAAASAPAADRVIRSGLELAFRVNPPDAFVLLDGAVIGRAEDWSGQRGGRSFTLPGTGSHQVKIKKAGMRDYRIAIEAGDTGGTTAVVVNLQPLPAAQIDTADLQAVRVREAIALRISPEVNAVVLVDGVSVGPVQKFAGRFGHSDEWLTLSNGTHRVTLIAPGYARRDLAVEVNPGADKARQKIDIPLSPATGNP
ncbi:MAG TPA: serine/threonine-protein kinase [Thermoanaerobaculia bacterium]|nr:serine/threonine-protein kinase [Thermoanaerobaculia bacterium]